MKRLNVFYLVFLFSTMGFAAQQEEQREDLIRTLKNRDFKYNNSNVRENYKYKDKVFGVDPKTGFLFMEIAPGQKENLEFDWEGSRGTISRNGKVIFRLNRNTITKEDRLAFNQLASYQRLKGIYNIKSVNSRCYLAYGKARLGSDAIGRISALERSQDPIPLFLENEKDLKGFENDLQALFKNLGGPNSFISIIGSSTTFFSENPGKGYSPSLYIGAPECLKNAESPEETLNVATFDMPGAKEPSDIDINILIPELSTLCEKSVQDSKEIGNDGTRRVYTENLLDKCFESSANPRIREMAQGGAEPDKWPLKGKAFQEFLNKWTPRLDNREINFSVRILPSQQKPPLKMPDAPDNFDKEIRYDRFVIPVN